MPVSCNLFTRLHGLCCQMPYPYLIRQPQLLSFCLCRSGWFQQCALVKSLLSGVSCYHSAAQPDYFLFNCSTNRLRPILLHILNRMGWREMGLLLFGSSWSPSFKIGETSAIFQARGKMPLVGEAGRLSLITLVGILSIPSDLFNDIDRTTSATCEHSTVVKLN